MDICVYAFIYVLFYCTSPLPCLSLVLAAGTHLIPKVRTRLSFNPLSWTHFLSSIFLLARHTPPLRQTAQTQQSVASCLWELPPPVGSWPPAQARRSVWWAPSATLSARQVWLRSCLCCFVCWVMA